MKKINSLLLITTLTTLISYSCKQDIDDTVYNNTIINGYTGTLTDIDNNNYKIVKIGEQWWMAENLRVTHYSDGTPIDLISLDDDWENLKYYSKSYCYYNNDSSMQQIYGNLYTWQAVVNDCDTTENGYIKGIAPDGWHIPSLEEWNILKSYLGDSAGVKIKDTNDILWERHKRYATNESVFSALPGGFKGTSGNSNREGFAAYWWTSTKDESNEINAYYTVVSHQSIYLGIGSGSIQFGNSVRCIKDK